MIQFHQDAQATVDVDADVIPDHYLAAATTAAYGLSFFLFAVADAAAAHSAVDAVTTAAYGSSFFLYSAADAAAVHLETTAVDATIVAVNKYSTDGEYSPSFFHIFLQHHLRSDYGRFSQKVHDAV